MNEILHPRKFALVFFNNISVYSKNEGDHLEQLKKVMEMLCQNQLYAKLSKCKFGGPQVTYIGHTISRECVQMEEENIIVIRNRKLPQGIKVLRTFLVLPGYYCGFAPFP